MPLTDKAKAYLEQVAASNAPAWNQIPPSEGRALFASLADFFGVGLELDRVEDREIAGVPVRVYAKNSSEPQAVMVYFHGGGWVIGDLNTHDTICRHLAGESDAVVVAVDYRLAPEHRYPSAFDDCYNVTRFIAQNPGEFGAAPGRIGVMGDSAGGNLAAAVCLKARDENDFVLQLQVLIYPVIEPTCETASFEDFAEGYGLTAEVMQWFWQQYIDGDTPPDPYLAPARAVRLGSLPPAHVVTAEFDVLRDEGEAYAARLSKAGTETTLRRYDGMIHGFFHLRTVFDEAQNAMLDIASIIKQRFA